MGELLDIYDVNRIKTGKIIERRSREKAKENLEKNEYVLCVQCWIINSKKEILLTQRKMEKTDGGKWEATGGVVQSGENSLQGIKRELREEIGIEAEESDLKLLKTSIDEHVIRDVYYMYKDIPINNFNFIDGEVMSAKYVTVEELENMINNGEAFEWSRWFIKAYSKII